MPGVDKSPGIVFRVISIGSDLRPGRDQSPNYIPDKAAMANQSERRQAGIGVDGWVRVACDADSIRRASARLADNCHFLGSPEDAAFLIEAAISSLAASFSASSLRDQ